MVKNLPASAGDPRDSVEKIPWSRKRQPAPVFFLGKFPRGAWQAAVHVVTKSQI